MQDTFWTDELVKEYASLYIKESWEQLGELKKNITSVEQFKSSKSPKKEWEVVAFKCDDKIFQLAEDGEVRDVDPAFTDGQSYFGLSYTMQAVNNCAIHSVRRLSDGEVFTKNEVVETPKDGQHHIGGFEIVGNDLVANFSTGKLLLKHLQKLPAAILTTVDGVEIFPGDKFWAIINWEVEPHKAKESDRGWWKKARIYSTEEVAQKYILENKPLLSLNDVKEAIGSNDVFGTLALRERLTALVKQKLNQ